MRISGITIPERRIDMALTVVYGVGRARARKILKEAGVDNAKLPKDLTTDEENKIRKIIEDEYQIEGNLKRLVSGNVKRLKDIGSYKGMRHSRGLPVRGQRTKTNSRTVRGNVRKTMGSGRVVATKT